MPQDDLDFMDHVVSLGGPSWGARGTPDSCSMCMHKRKSTQVTDLNAFFALQHCKCICSAVKHFIASHTVLLAETKHLKM